MVCWKYTALLSRRLILSVSVKYRVFSFSIQKFGSRFELLSFLVVSVMGLSSTNFYSVVTCMIV
jgi:hypothetical protein